MCHSAATQQRNYAAVNTATAFTLAVVAERFQEVLQDDQVYREEVEQSGDNESSRPPRDSESSGSEQGDDEEEYAGNEESDEEEVRC